METWKISEEFPISVHHKSSKHNGNRKNVFICHWSCVLQNNDIRKSGRRHKLLPCFIWTAAAQWMTAATTNVCFPLKSNDDHPWQAVPPSCPHARMSLFSFCPHPSVELLYPCGCTHPLSSLCHHIPPRPVPDSDEHWRGGRNQSTRLKYGSNYKQKDVSKGWPMKAPCLPPGSGNTGGLLGEARAENERENGGIRRFCLREAEITECFEVRKSNCR